MIKFFVSVFGLSFLFFGNVFALEVEHQNPIWQDIANTANGNATCTNNDKIGANANASANSMQNTANDYCVNMGFDNASSYVEEIVGNPDICKFTNSTWKFDTSNVDYFSSITCYSAVGCTNPNSSNYDPNATTDDGSCNTCSVNDFQGCSQVGCDTLSNTQWLNSQCVANQLGCTDSNAENYNPNANTGSTEQYCIYCSVSEPNNCSNANDCSLVGGNWDSTNAVCLDSNSEVNQVEGAITIELPDPALSQPFLNPLSANYIPFVNQRCVEFASNGLCVSSVYDLSEDTIDFLVSFSVKLIANLFLFFLIFAIVRFLTFYLFRLFKK